MSPAKMAVTREVPGPWDKVYEHIDRSFPAHVARFQEFVRQKSVSPLNVGMDDCARLVSGYFKDLGCQRVDIVDTPLYPVVYGEYDGGNPHTWLVYLMYDTQPVEGEKWTSPPFDAKIVEKKGLGKVLIGRGAINSKGPMTAFLNAMKSIREVTGKIPVNLLLIAEGEEEMGSRSLPGFVEKYMPRLKKADTVFMPLPAMDERGLTKVFVGVKGLAYLELECSGALWGRGPTDHDIHSSSKTIVDSPVWRMIKALSTMVSEDGNRILIDGFYDEVLPPGGKDLRLLDALAKTFHPDQMKIEIGDVDQFIGGTGDMRALLERYLYQTTLNIDGIWGGYIYPGSKTVLPHKVECKIDIRLVPNQSGEKQIERVRQHLAKHGYSDIAVKKLHTYPWAKADPDSPIAQAHVAALESFGYQTEVWPHAPGTGPWYLFTDPPLSLPCVIGGLGVGARAHAPDEYFVIEGEPGVSGFAECEKAFVRTVYEYLRLVGNQE